MIVMKYVELRTRPTAESVRSERSGFVGDRLRDGLLAKSGLGLRAGVAGHTRKSPRMIDKSSPMVDEPQPTVAEVTEVVA